MISALRKPRKGLEQETLIDGLMTKFEGHRYVTRDDFNTIFEARYGEDGRRDFTPKEVYDLLNALEPNMNNDVLTIIAENPREFLRCELDSDFARDTRYTPLSQRTSYKTWNSRGTDWRSNVPGFVQPLV